MTDAEATVRSSIIDGIAAAGVHPGPNMDPMIDSIVRTLFARCVRWSARAYADELDAHTHFTPAGPSKASVDTCSICGVACRNCSRLGKGHEQIDRLESALAKMTTFRDNASFREAMALRERDEARAERDALYRFLVRAGADKRRVKRLMRMARNRVAKGNMT